MSLIAPHPLLDELLKGPWGADFLLRASLEVEDINFMGCSCEIHRSNNRLIVVDAVDSLLKYDLLLDPHTNSLAAREGVVQIRIKSFRGGNRFPFMESKVDLKFWPGDMDQCYKNFRNMVKYVSGVDPYVL